MSTTREHGNRTRARLLDAMPGTASQIASKVSVTIQTAGACVREFRGDMRAHIGDWEYGANGKLVAVYFAGPGVDAPEPSHGGRPAFKPVAVGPIVARYDDTVMPRAFFGGVR